MCASITSYDNSYLLVWLLTIRILNSESTLLVSYKKYGDQEIKYMKPGTKLIVGSRL